MAELVVHRPPPPTPTTVSQAINDVKALLQDIWYKLKTLIGYYIHPDITPTEIKAFEPRLEILLERLHALSRLSYPHLAHLIDSADQLAAMQYLHPIIDQLLNAAHGIPTIFANHYDASLHDRRPFSTISSALHYRSEQVRMIPQWALSNPRHVMPEDQGPNEIGKFCHGALQMLNYREKGKISVVDKRYLSDVEQQRIREVKGAFLDWECPDCAFKVHFHVSSSATSNIHTTDEIRQHDQLKVQYRSSFLAKCHLYSPTTDRTTNSTTRRRDSVILSSSKRENAALLLRAKYGCIFCYALGRELEYGRTSFYSPKDLAGHFSARHRRPVLPSLLIHRFNVAIEGKMFQERLRWDVNLL
eukprot:TRINITY_DN7444_c0_g1_i1.p1 TRINITY_DN7444_c0_g1~~TRINITY_DN7444_c0_g1_i1.p1  ORF type:complete len:359 (-),score=6.94 TRINITY_DN7444_c0_g1_i1:468-1544(-)